MSKISEFVTEYIDGEMYLMIPLGTEKRDVGAIAAEKFCLDVLTTIEVAEGGGKVKATDLKFSDSVKKIRAKIKRIFE